MGNKYQQQLEVREAFKKCIFSHNLSKGLGGEAGTEMENRKVFDIEHDKTLQRRLQRNRGPLLNYFFLISNISVINWTS